MDLPSRFQIGESVTVNGINGRVIGVSFSFGKVAYSVEDKHGAIHSPVMSENVHPATHALRLVK